MILFVNATVTHQEQADDGAVSTVVNEASVATRLGWRTYRVSGRRVTPYLTFGPTFAFSHSHRSGTNPSTFKVWGLGVFGDIGALYHVTSNLALSATGTVDVSYAGTSITSPTAGTTTLWEIRLAGVNIAAGLTLLF